MIRSFDNYLAAIAAKEDARMKALEIARNEFVDEVNKFAAEADIGYAIVEDFLTDYEKIVSSYVEYKANGVEFAEKNALVSEIFRGGIEKKIPSEAEAFHTYFVELRKALDEYSVSEFIQWYLDDTWVCDEDSEYTYPENTELFKVLLILYKEYWIELKRLASKRCVVKEHI